MSINSTIPPTLDIEFYQVRMMVNQISGFNHHIFDFDPYIFERVKRIAAQAANLSESLRNSLPMLKLKTNYIINSKVESCFTDKYPMEENELKSTRQLMLLSFIDDFSDLKNELNKLKLPLRSGFDFLLALQLDEQTQQKKHVYVNQQLQIQQTNNKQKMTEVHGEISLITQAEEIILKHKLSNLFDHFFPEINFINAMDLPPSKKELLKAAIECAKGLLIIIDNGLEFMSLVDARLYLAGEFSYLHKQSQQFEERKHRLDYLISLANDVSQLDQTKLQVANHFQSLYAYLNLWHNYMASCLTENTFNVYNAIKSCEKLMEFIVETEYQYQRQLAD